MSPRYLAACDRVGQLLTAQQRAGLNLSTERPSDDRAGREVARHLKALSLRPLMQVDMLAALLDAIDGVDDLRGFRQLFAGLLAILDLETD
jgi:hypothetical protein